MFVRRLFLVSSTLARIECDGFVKGISEPVERRGGDRKFAKYLAKTRSIIQFVQKCRRYEIHYCRGKTKRQYFPSELSINKMYRMYCDENTDSSLHVKGSYFRHVFNNNFNIGFKALATDICSTCQMLKEKIKFENDPNKKRALMIQLTLHKRRAKASYNLLKDDRRNLLNMSFDCQKNMAMPKVFDQAAYFSRQISLYNFGIVMGSSKTPLTKENVFNILGASTKGRKVQTKLRLQSFTVFAT